MFILQDEEETLFLRGSLYLRGFVKNILYELAIKKDSVVKVAHFDVIKSIY